MKKARSLVLTSVACVLSAFSFGALADSPVCNNLQSIIHQQKQNYVHYQTVNHDAHINIKRANINVTANQKLIAKEKKKIADLVQSLAAEKKHLSYTANRLKVEQRNVAMAAKNIKEVPADVMANEEQLIAVLTDKYRDMCLMRNPQDPAQSALVQQFYP
jgi:septal ring factor EnvC (AmiA/AmiB activator)